MIGLEDAGSRGQWETASRPCRIPGRRQAQPGRQSHPVNRIQAVRHHTVRAAEVDRSAGELRLAKVDRFPGELRAVEVDLTAGELCPPEADRSAGEPRGGEPDQPSGGSRTRRAAAAYVLLQVVAAALALWLSKHFQVARLSTTLVALAPEDFYNSHRPHQGIVNARPLHPMPMPISDLEQITHLDIRRRQRLGGILHEYHPAA